MQVLGEDRPVVFYDQLGCGNSDRPSDLSLWSLERFVEELSLVMQHIGLEDFHLFGHSWGSILVVNYYATLRPKGMKSMTDRSPSLSIPRSYDDVRGYLEKMPSELREAVRMGELSGDTTGPDFKRAVRAYNRRHLCRVEPPPECMKKSAFEELTGDCGPFPGLEGLQDNRLYAKLRLHRSVDEDRSPHPLHMRRT